MALISVSYKSINFINQARVNSLGWDGGDHFSQFISHIQGDGKTVIYENGTEQPLHEVILNKWLLGCVDRALTWNSKKSHKHQNPMLVLTGAQGIGKSSLFRWLCSCFGANFHREGKLRFDDKELHRTMANAFIWELSELNQTLDKASREEIKGLITQQSFTFKVPFAKYTLTRPVLCNLCATTNPGRSLLSDTSGNRRYLPIEITAIDHTYTQVDVNQLWAQLVHEHQNGAQMTLTREENEAMEVEREAVAVEDPLDEWICKYFDVNPDQIEWFTSTADIIELLRDKNLPLHNDGKRAAEQVCESLRRLGLNDKTHKRREGGARGARGYAGVLRK